MAERRSVSTRIIDDDQFLELPAGAQLLYFHLSSRADDDGFITPKKVMKVVGATKKDLDALIDGGYLIEFESGVVVITHWRINNSIRKDRHSATSYAEELSELSIIDGKYVRTGRKEEDNGQPSDNQVTTNCQPSGCQDGNQMTTSCQPSDNHEVESWLPQGAPSPCNPLPLQERNESFHSTNVMPHKESTAMQGTASWIDPPSIKEVRDYFAASGLKGNPDAFFDSYSSVGWIDKFKRAVTDWRAAARKWAAGENYRPSPIGRASPQREKPRDYDGSYDAARMTEVRI